MTSPETPALSVHDLHKRFGDKHAVRGLSLTVPPGQVVGFLGPNGAGKSTTIRMLMGMSAPSEGSARVFGLDPVADGPEVKRIAGFVPESGAVFEALTGWEHLELVAALHGLDAAEARARVVRFASFLDLAEADLGQVLSGYSKGMKQKVAITAALLHNPRIVFFDEPLNGLDANAALKVKTLIASLAREGKTIVYCSHILDVVERICERVVIVHAGQLVADGSVDALRAAHQAESLEGVFNRLTGTENMLERAEAFARELAV